MELRRMRKELKWRRARRHDEELQGRELVEDDVSVSSKKERLEGTDLSLESPSPETTSVETDSELRLRLRSKRPAVDSQVEQSKRSCASELSCVRWSAPSREKRNLEVDEEMQSKKQCISEMLDSDEELHDENEVNDDHEVAKMEQLVQRAARKRNERGANACENR